MNSDTQGLQRDKNIGRQMVLPLSKAVEIAWKSIKIRFWRSVITTSGIVLAIAFLMSIFTDTVFNNALRSVEEDHPRYPLVESVIQEQALEDEDVVIRVGILPEHDDKNEMARETLRFLQGRAQMLSFLLPSEPSPLKDELLGQTEMQPMDVMFVAGFPGRISEKTVMEAIEAFVDNGGALFVLGYENLWPEDVDQNLKNTFLSLLSVNLEDDVFEVSAQEIEETDHRIAGQVNWEKLPDSKYLSFSALEGSEIIAQTQDGGIAFAGKHGDGYVCFVPVAGQMTGDSHLFRWVLREGLLPASVLWGARDKLRGDVLPARTLWLVALSLMVCVVGITNAMLMSVTERFREIGTMKCLGALDKFVIRLFLIESSFQGAAGALAGVLVGFLLSFIRILFSFRAQDVVTGDMHWLALEFFPGVDLLIWALVSLIVGIIISVIAAIYPAYTAARMEPVEAMRVEA